MSAGDLHEIWRADIAQPVGLAWLDAAGSLLVCDPAGGRIASLDPASGAMAFLGVPGSPSFCFPTSEGELLIGNGADLVRIDGEGRSALEIRIDMPAHLATASATVDALGRLWFVARDRRAGGEGRVYRYHDARMVPSLFDRTRPGGLAVSADGRTLFHANGPARTIEAYRVSPAAALSAGEPRFSLPASSGEPQDMALDSAGALWVALSGSSDAQAALVRLAPDGAVLEEIAVPASAVSAIAFGGEGLRTLFVAVPGAILALPMTVPGVPLVSVRLGHTDLGLIEDDDH